MSGSKGDVKLKRRILFLFSVLPCVLVGAAATSTSAAADDSSVTISVPAAEPWAETDVDVSIGESVSIVASGSIHISTTGPGTTPAGEAGCVASTNPVEPAEPFLAPGLTCWSLVGRIGGGPAFEVGDGTSFIATSSGELNLSVNDNYFSDNSGAWTVTITAVPPV